MGAGRGILGSARSAGPKLDFRWASQGHGQLRHGSLIRGICKKLLKPGSIGALRMRRSDAVASSAKPEADPALVAAPRVRDGRQKFRAGAASKQGQAALRDLIPGNPQSSWIASKRMPTAVMIDKEVVWLTQKMGRVRASMALIVRNRKDRSPGRSMTGCRSYLIERYMPVDDRRRYGSGAS
jgi:hypothetical protein